ncbi:hypothetical protein A4X09_0g4967 [Tilletia walkeri]|uniref:Uncharacterized protein n=1 Tax=Tilletia walkeri TaxID=117179 RepID=A0A8X7N820_9BASI|nr:hypothetical protein A4X09_0g4967 [Tilletia walkeri]
MPQRRLRASTISHSTTLDLVQEADELASLSSSQGTLRHSDPTTRHLVSSLTKRSKTLADAVAKRREVRSRSSSLSSPAPPQQPAEPVTTQSQDAELDAVSVPSSLPPRRRVQVAASPTKPPSIPLPPLPEHSPSRLRNTLMASDYSPASIGHDSHNSPTGNRPSHLPSTTISASSTPINTPRAILRSLPSLPAPDQPLPMPPTQTTMVKTRFASPNLDKEVACESSDEEMLADELSQMEHGLEQFQTAFFTPSSSEDQIQKLAAANDHWEAVRSSSRFETPDSTPIIPSEPFTAKLVGGALLDVPEAVETDVECTPMLNRGSRDSISTAASDISAQALFDLRPRGDSTSTNASSTDNQATLMQRSFSQGSSIPSESRRKDKATFRRRNSLFVATPPTRLASLENLRAAGAGLVRQEFGEPVAVRTGDNNDQSVEVEGGSLGLTMGLPSQFQDAGVPNTQNNTVLLGSWLDESLTGSRPGRSIVPTAGTMSWADDDSSEDSDEQRFVPVPVRGAHKRFNSADSSILSINESLMESVIDVGRKRIPSPSQSATGSEIEEMQEEDETKRLRRSASLTPDQTPKSSPPLQPLLLPSEAIMRSSELRLTTGPSFDSTNRSPYAGLQARAQAKMATSEAQSAFQGSMSNRNFQAGPSSNAFIDGVHTGLLSGGGARHPFGMVNAARHDADNQSVHSVAFVHAPTPPITPMRATAGSPVSTITSTPRRPSTADTLTRTRSPDDASGSGTFSLRPTGTLGRVAGAFSTAHSSTAPTAIEGLTRSGTLPLASSTSAMTRSSSATDGLVPHQHVNGLSSGQGAMAELGDPRRSAPNSMRIGKLRTTIFDSFGIKKGRVVEDGQSLPSERAQSPVGSAASHSNQHLGVGDGSGSMFSSLIRRTSVASSQGGGSGSSHNSSAPSSSKVARPHQLGSATLSPSSSPLKRTMKLPDVESMHSAPSSVSSKRERIPSSDSQLSLRAPSATSHGESRYSLKSGPSSSTHGTKSSSSSQLSSPSPDRPTAQSGSRSHWGHSEYGATSSIRSGSSRGKKGGSGAASERSRPVRKEEVAKVNAVLAELQGAGFMAPPMRKKTSKSSSFPGKGK